MRRLWLVAGAISGFIAVAAGAFGAHALQGVLPPDRLATYDTAVRYQLWHALALLAVGILAHRAPRRGVLIAGWGFAAGTILFSGSLYALVASGLTGFGAITPFGGLGFLVGWAALACVGWSDRPQR